MFRLPPWYKPKCTTFSYTCRFRSLHRQDDRSVVRGLDPVHELHRRGEPGAGDGGPDALDVGDDVGGGHRVAIVELHLPAQVEGVGQPVVRDVEAFDAEQLDAAIGPDRGQRLAVDLPAADATGVTVPIGRSVTQPREGPHPHAAFLPGRAGPRPSR